MRTKLNVEATQRELLTQIRTEGVQAAYAASLAVCRDPKAPAPARATASATLFRVAGYFDKAERADHKEPHEMDAHELSAAVANIRRQLTAKVDDADIFD